MDFVRLSHQPLMSSHCAARLLPRFLLGPFLVKAAHQIPTLLYTHAAIAAFNLVRHTLYCTGLLLRHFPLRLALKPSVTPTQLPFKASCMMATPKQHTSPVGWLSCSSPCHVPNTPTVCA